MHMNLYKNGILCNYMIRMYKYIYKVYDTWITLYHWYCGFYTKPTFIRLYMWCQRYECQLQLTKFTSCCTIIFCRHLDWIEWSEHREWLPLDSWQQTPWLVEWLDTRRAKWFNRLCWLYCHDALPWVPKQYLGWQVLHSDISVSLWGSTLNKWASAIVQC